MTFKIKSSIRALRRRLTPKISRIPEPSQASDCKIMTILYAWRSPARAVGSRSGTQSASAADPYLTCYALHRDDPVSRRI